MLLWEFYYRYITHFQGLFIVLLYQDKFCNINKPKNETLFVKKPRRTFGVKHETVNIALIKPFSLFMI